MADIVSGNLPPGSMLPRELELVEQFGTSRGVVRECIRGLEERGLVRVKHGAGATVLARSYWDVFDSDVVGALLDSPEGTSMLADFVECRRLLEVEAAGLAAQRGTEVDMEHIRQTLDHMEEMAERAARNTAAEDMYHESDIQFHRAVFEAAHNQALLRMAEPLHHNLIARRVLARPQRRFDRGLPEHRRICSAVMARNSGEARAAMLDHLVTVEGYLHELEQQRGREPAEGAATGAP